MTAPAVLLDLRAGWPFPGLDQTDRAYPITWARIADDDAMTLLECMPPIWWGGSDFAMLEASRHTDEGEPVRTVVTRVVGRGHWATTCTRGQYAERLAALWEAFRLERLAASGAR